MRKAAAIAELERIKLRAEEEKDSQLAAFAVIELLLAYNNDPEIRQAVDRIPF